MEADKRIDDIKKLGRYAGYELPEEEHVNEEAFMEGFR